MTVRAERRRRCDICGDLRSMDELRNEGKPEYPKWVCRDSFRCWGGRAADDVGGVLADPPTTKGAA